MFVFAPQSLYINHCLDQFNITFMNLTLRGSCIVIYSCNKTNEKHQFLKFIYGIGFYMFRTVSLSIIKSLALYTQQWYRSDRLC